MDAQWSREAFRAFLLMCGWHEVATLDGSGIDDPHTMYHKARGTTHYFVDVYEDEAVLTNKYGANNQHLTFANAAEVINKLGLV